MQPEPKQVDIKTMSVEELYKLALEQQKNATAFIAQGRQADANATQAHMNVAAIEAEIARRLAEKVKA